VIFNAFATILTHRLNNSKQHH